MRPEWLIAASKKRAKLTDEQREQIRWLVRVNQHELARHFGVNVITIKKLQSDTKRYGFKGKPVWVKIPKEQWATRKGSKRFEQTLEKKRQNKRWVRTVEQFKEYHRKPDALYHAKLNGLKTHCKRRHALSGANVYVHNYRGKVMRQCVTCFRITRRKHSAKIHKKRKADRARRRGIETQEGVREQYWRNLWDIEQAKTHARKQGYRKRLEASKIQELLVNRREEENAKESEFQHVT